MKKYMKRSLTIILAAFVAMAMFLPFMTRESFADEWKDVKYSTAIKISAGDMYMPVRVMMGDKTKGAKKVEIKSSNEKVAWPSTDAAKYDKWVMFVPQKKGTAIITVTVTNKNGSKSTYKIGVGVKTTPPKVSGSTKKVDLSKASITLSKTKYMYNFKEHKPSVTVKLSGKKLTKGTDYTISYSNNKNAGKATVTIRGTGNYKGSAAKRFTIEKCSMGKEYISAKLKDTSYEYTGKEIKPSITVYFNGKTKLKKGTHYTVSYLYNKNIGKAYVEITGKGNFKSNGRLFAFKITKGDQPLKLSSGNISKRYKDLGSSTTVTVSGIKERAGLTVTSSNDKVATVKKAGDGYKITYRGAGTAKITFKTNKETKHYKVTSKTIKITVVDDRNTPKINLPKRSYSVLPNSAVFNLKASTDSDGAISYTSSDNSVATVDGAGNVTICGKVGTATIVVSVKSTMKNKTASATVTINVVDKTKGEQIVEYAKGYLGYPYVLNTHGPNSFDCSGFVYYVFKEKFGIELSTGSSDYWNNPGAFGTVVSESEAMPGDVVSWSGHVGIYIGNGQVINALNPSSGVCIIKVNAYCNSSGTQNPPHKYIRISGF